MQRTQVLVYDGKVIFRMDFANLKKPEQIHAIIIESISYIREQPAKSVLTLTNVEGMHFSNEIKEAFRVFIKGNAPYVKSGAVVGLSGLQMIIYNGLMKVTGRDIKSFENENEAKEWLSRKS